MVLVLFNFIFSAVTVITDILSQLILSATAFLLVLVIQALKLSGGAFKVVVDELCDGLRWFAEAFFVSLVEVIGSVFSTLSDVTKGGISVCSNATGSAIVALGEQTRNSFGLLLKGLAQVLGAFTEMLSTIGTNLGKNFRDAAGYVTKYA